MSFIRDLYWPGEVFAKHLKQALKLMACDVIFWSLVLTVLTGMEIQERWNHLRNSVVQELRDQTKNHSGDGARHRKKSLYFWSLLFLMSTGFASKQCQTFPMMKKRQEMMTHQKRQLPPRGKKGKQEMNTF